MSEWLIEYKVEILFFSLGYWGIMTIFSKEKYQYTACAMLIFTVMNMVFLHTIESLSISSGAVVVSIIDLVGGSLVYTYGRSRKKIIGWLFVVMIVSHGLLFIDVNSYQWLGFETNMIYDQYIETIAGITFLQMLVIADGFINAIMGICSRDRFSRHHRHECLETRAVIARKK